MARIYLTNETADVTGYLAGYVNTRRPASTALTLSSTATTASGNLIQATTVQGGTALAWITKPFAAAVTITSILVTNVWAAEAAAAVNAAISTQLHEYTSSEQATFWAATAEGAELPVPNGTAAARVIVVSTTGTATTIDAGNRLVIKLYIMKSSAGAMGASDVGVMINYDGPTEGADGDTFVDFTEAIRVNEQQTGPGTYPITNQVGVGFYQNIIDGLNAAAGMNAIDNSNAITTLIDDLGYQRDNL